MDRQLHTISHALTDVRVQVAQRFQQLTQTTDKAQLAHFMLAYCRQAAALVRWMSEWNEQLRQSSVAAGREALATVFGTIAEKLNQRHLALVADVESTARWLKAQFGSQADIQNEKIVMSSGMKKLRFVAQECVKRNHYESWLLIMTEIERLRIVHGFTLIKLCEVHFGRAMLRCFSHIHYQHQHQNELFALCETTLKSQIKLQDAAIQSMIAELKIAITAYASFIDDCYAIASKWVIHEKSAVS